LKLWRRDNVSTKRGRVCPPWSSDQTLKVGTAILQEQTPAVLKASEEIRPIKSRGAGRPVATPEGCASETAEPDFVSTSSLLDAPLHFGRRSPKILARSLSRLGRLISRFGRLISHFAEELEVDGWRVAFRSTGALVESYVRSRWAWGRQRLAANLAHARNRVKSMLPMPSRRGVLFIGYVEACLGLAESLRGLIAAAAERQIQFGICPFRIGVETRIIEPFMPEKFDRKHRYDVNVIEVSPGQVPTVFKTVDSRQLATSYNVLRTYWELPKAPREWGPMLKGIDEIWVPNEFVRNAFKGIFSGPITIIPPCVSTEEVNYPSAAEFDMERGRFYFLFSFDFFSSHHRKNPLGVLKAFRLAFPNLNENVGLIIKSTGFETHQTGFGPHQMELEQFRASLDKDHRIRIIHDTMSRQRMLGLIRACDCYVSLHRAEGFGLGMAEAMSFGKVVIGTDYSGSTDFLSAETGFPVAYHLRPLRPDEYFWPQDQVWAEPNMDSAVAMFRQAFNDVNARTRKAAAGKAFVDRKYSKAAVGAAVEQRIDEISRQRAGGFSPSHT
jgi:glycosyltransferase involved in cell wall biosynthesis